MQRLAGSRKPNCVGWLRRAFTATRANRYGARRPPVGTLGAPVWVDGGLYCITVDGYVVAIRAGPRYERWAVNALGEKSHATPAVAGGRMYLRTYSHVICVGGE